MTADSAEETAKNGQKSDDSDNMTTTEYCAQLQQWMWRYYCGYASWQSWVLMSAPLFPPPQFGCQAPGSSTSAYAATPADIAAWYNQTSPPSSRPAATATSSTADRGPAAQPQPAGTVAVNPMLEGDGVIISCIIKRTLTYINEELNYLHFILL